MPCNPRADGVVLLACCDSFPPRTQRSVLYGCQRWGHPGFHHNCGNGEPKYLWGTYRDTLTCVADGSQRIQEIFCDEITGADTLVFNQPFLGSSACFGVSTIGLSQVTVTDTDQLQEYEFYQEPAHTLRFRRRLEVSARRIYPPDLGFAAFSAIDLSSVPIGQQLRTGCETPVTFAPTSVFPGGSLADSVCSMNDNSFRPSGRLATLIQIAWLYVKTEIFIAEPYCLVERTGPASAITSCQVFPAPPAVTSFLLVPPAPQVSPHAGHCLAVDRYLKNLWLNARQPGYAPPTCCFG